MPRGRVILNFIYRFCCSFKALKLNMLAAQI